MFLVSLIMNCCFYILVECLLSCRYESIIATLCESLDTLDEPEAKVTFLSR